MQYGGSLVMQRTTVTGCLTERLGGKCGSKGEVRAAQLGSYGPPEVGFGQADDLVLCVPICCFFICLRSGRGWAFTTLYTARKQAASASCFKLIGLHESEILRSKYVARLL